MKINAYYSNACNTIYCMCIDMLTIFCSYECMFLHQVEPFHLFLFIKVLGATFNSSLLCFIV